MKLTVVTRTRIMSEQERNLTEEQRDEMYDWCNNRRTMGDGSMEHLQKEWAELTEKWLKEHK